MPFELALRRFPLRDGWREGLAMVKPSTVLVLARQGVPALLTMRGWEVWSLFRGLVGSTNATRAISECLHEVDSSE